MTVVEVSVAIIQRPDGAVLLAQRPGSKTYAGYWEFPGGKLEQGETPLAALIREIREELGVEIVTVYPWVTRSFAYAHANVRLHFFRVWEWEGIPYAKEHQSLSWQRPEQLEVNPLLPANLPILRALNLPSVYAISNVKELGVAEFLVRAEAALKKGLRMLVLRENQLSEDDTTQLLDKLVTLARPYGARVLVHSNTQNDLHLADGVHASAKLLMQWVSRPRAEFVGASCHNAQELARAAELNLDFVVLSPVLPTPSHPNEPYLGWSKFTTLIENYPIPVYALGGMENNTLIDAYRAGGQGIAMLRNAWMPALF